MQAAFKLGLPPALQLMSRMGLPKVRQIYLALIELMNLNNVKFEVENLCGESHAPYN